MIAAQVMPTRGRRHRGAGHPAAEGPAPRDGAARRRGGGRLPDRCRARAVVSQRRSTAPMPRPASVRRSRVRSAARRPTSSSTIRATGPRWRRRWPGSGTGCRRRPPGSRHVPEPQSPCAPTADADAGTIARSG